MRVVVLASLALACEAFTLPSYVNVPALGSCRTRSGIVALNNFCRRPNNLPPVGSGGSADASQYYPAGEAPSTRADGEPQSEIVVQPPVIVGAGGAAPASAYYPSGEAPLDADKPVPMQATAVSTYNPSSEGALEWNGPDDDTPLLKKIAAAQEMPYAAKADATAKKLRYHKVGTGGAAPASTYYPQETAVGSDDDLNVKSLADKKATYNKVGTSGAAPASSYYPKQTPAEPENDTPIKSEATKKARHHTVGTGGAAPASSYYAPEAGEAAREADKPMILKAAAAVAAAAPTVSDTPFDEVPATKAVQDDGTLVKSDATGVTCNDSSLEQLLAALESTNEQILQLKDENKKLAGEVASFTSLALTAKAGPADDTPTKAEDQVCAKDSSLEQLLAAVKSTNEQILQLKEENQRLAGEVASLKSLVANSGADKPANSQAPAASTGDPSPSPAPPLRPDSLADTAVPDGLVTAEASDTRMARDDNVVDNCCPAPQWSNYPYEAAADGDELMKPAVGTGGAAPAESYYRNGRGVAGWIERMFARFRG